jgi:hypothetical protein
MARLAGEVSPVEQHVASLGGDQLNVRAMPWSYGVEAGIFNCDCLVAWAQSIEVKAPKSASKVVRVNRRKYLSLKELGRISGKPAIVVCRWLDGLGWHVVDGTAGLDVGTVRIAVSEFRGV